MTVALKEVTQPIDLAHSSQGKFTLLFTNNDLSLPVRIVLDEVVADDGAWTFRIVEPVVVIEPGKRHESEVLVFAGDPGIVGVTALATAQAGLFSGRHALPQRIRARAWKEIEITPFERMPGDCDSAICNVKAELSVGEQYENGLECSALLSGYPDVEFVLSRTSLDGGTATRAETDEQHISKFVWREPTQMRFSQRTVSLTLHADPPPEDWEPIVDQIVRRCAALYVP